MMTYRSFNDGILRLRTDLLMTGYKLHAPKWQGVDVSKKPEMAMRELFNISFQVSMNQSVDLDYYRRAIRPNLPWADDHFQERVSGQPLNPGETWKSWPWGHSADKFRTEGPQHNRFTHTYMERYWPKHAGDFEYKEYGPHLDGRETTERLYRSLEHSGIRYPYGDLNNVVDQLQKDPLTRQAYLPIWFPEDTGVSHGGRVPCTLGYHFLMRNDFFHHTYYIRSCDIIRHFQDDIYLSIRLHLWVLNKLRERDSRWLQVKPGWFVMHIVSLHCFENDLRELQKAPAA